MRILVTGAAGFIGSHVCRHLIAEGHDVLGVDDLSGGIDNATGAFPWRLADCRLGVDMEDVFSNFRPEVVFHLAAYAAEGLSHYIRVHNALSNGVATAVVLGAALRHKVRRFVFTSSMAVYGYNGSDKFHERLECEPEDPYGAYKLAAEWDIRATAETHGMEWVIWRPHNVYGPGQNLNDPFRNVVGIFMRQAMRGEPCTIFGDGNQVRAFSYIDDVAPIIARSATDDRLVGKVINIGGDDAFTINGLFEAVRATAPSLVLPPVATYLPARHEVKLATCYHWVLDELYPHRHWTPLNEGLRAMWDWAITQDVTKHAAIPAIELEDGLPPSWKALVDAKHTAGLGA